MELVMLAFVYQIDHSNFDEYKLCQNIFMKFNCYLPIELEGFPFSVYHHVVGCLSTLGCL